MASGKNLRDEELEVFSIEDGFHKEEVMVFFRRLYFEMGFSQVWRDRVSFNLLGGVEFGYADRDVPNCYSCKVENIPFKGGVYIKPVLEWMFLRLNNEFGGVGLRFSYRVSNNSIQHALKLGLFVGFPIR